MSVTFHYQIKDSDLRGFEVYDHESEMSYMYPTYEAACEGWKVLGASPDSWSLSPRYEIPSSMDVQMSNDNARDVLDVLGIAVGQPFSEWCSGSIEPTDLIGRCLVALAIAHDPGVSTPGTVGTNGARLLASSRKAGYLHDKCEAILLLAEQAKSDGRLISWT